MRLICYIAAIICFILGMFGVPYPALLEISLGLAFFTAGHIVPVEMR